VSDEQRTVIIEKGDRQVAVVLADYRSKAIDAEGHTYQQLGWRVVRFEDDRSPYKPPACREEPDTEARPARRPSG
jgi:hypothetical protein